MDGLNLWPKEWCRLKKLHTALGDKGIELIFTLSFLVVDLDISLDYNLTVHVAIDIALDIAQFRSRQ